MFVKPIWAVLSDDEQKIVKFSLNNEQMSNKPGG